MKFQDSSFNCLKVTVGAKKCDARTDARTLQKQYVTPTFFKVGGFYIKIGGPAIGGGGG